MATIDDRVVAMSFENSKFERGVATSLSTLDKLKEKLNFTGAAKGLSDIEAKSSHLNFAGMGQAIEGLSGKFSTLRVTALTALETIVSRATTAGLSIAKSLTIAPITAGLREYETGMNAVQTILSNTSAAGTNLKDVNKALNELNRYADLTIYNFSEMTRNVGTFTAAGVGLTTAVGSIKGIANLAALSGSNAEQAATAMYQLSQAISAGRVNLQDWNSVVNAGMGGTIFQRALAQTAVHMGTLKESAVTLKGEMKNVTIEGKSFRESIMGSPGKQSWLTGEVLTKTLEQLSGNLSDAQLKAQGYNDAQIKAIQAQAKAALDAATKVKTLSQLLDTAREAAGSGWAMTWQLIFGDFGQAKNLFTGLSNAVNGMIGRSADARNKVLKDWQKLGGRTDLLKGLEAVFDGLLSVLKPIKEAFREIFPATTGKSLADLTERFRNFAETLKIGPETADRIKRAFAGLFAVLDIGKQIISGVFHVFGTLFGAVVKSSGGFLEIAARVGDWLVALDKAIKKGEGLTKFFDFLGHALAVPIALLGALAHALLGLHTDFDLSKVWDGFLKGLDKVGGKLGPTVRAIGEAFGDLGNAIISAFKAINFEQALDVLQVGLLGGIGVMIARFFSKGLPGLGRGILGNLSGAFSQLTGTLKAMQNNIKAKTLLEIAGAIGLLAASIVALSMIKPEALNKALVGLGVAFGELLGAMKILDSIGGKLGFATLPILAGGLILLAGAIDLLVLAVVGLSMLSWDKLEKGLFGVGAMLAILVVAAKPLAASSKGMIVAGLGITALAVGLNILVPAILAFGHMDLRTIGVGLGTVAAALIVIGAAMHLMPPSLPLTAAGLVLVSGALQLIGIAIFAMGSMSLEKIAKGLGTLAGSLAILALGLHAMTGALPGAAALLVASGALMLLAPALRVLGHMSWDEIVHGLVALAGSLTALGIAGALMGGVAPALLALGVAMLTIGGGFALLGLGITLISTGLSALAVAGPAGIKVLVSAFTEFAKALPKFVSSFVDAIVVMITKLGENAPKFVTALGKILVAMAEAIVVAAPELAKAMIALIDAAITAIRAKFPDIVKVGFEMLMELLRGIRDNIVQITTAVAEIVVKFLGALAAKTADIVKGGFDVLVNFLKGISNNIGRVVTTVGEIVVKFLTSLAAKIPDIMKAGADVLVKFLEGIANNLGRIVDAVAGIAIKFATEVGKNAKKFMDAGFNAILKLVEGFGKGAVDLVTAGANAAATFIESLSKGLLLITVAAFTAILAFLTGLRSAVQTYLPQIMIEAVKIGEAIVRGIAQGLGYGLGSLLKMPFKIATDLAKGFAKGVDSGSPSRVFAKLGESIILGLQLGIGDNAHMAVSAATDAAKAVINSFETAFGIHSPSDVMYEIGKFVGEGFANGLKGSGDDISSAFSELNTKLTEAIRTANETVKTEKAKLDELLAAKKQDTKAIKEAQDIIAQNQDLINKAKAAHAELVVGLKSEKTELIGLSKEFETIGKRLEAAQQKLADAKQMRDDAVKSYTEQYSTLPDITTDPERQWASLQDYTKTLTDKIAAVKAYKNTLDQLRKLGLDDETYKKLLTEGTADQEFANQLLAGGKTAVWGLNTLDAELERVSKNLGTNAAKNLYQAGVDAAQGLVDGLRKKKNAIRNEMEDIAEEMIKAIRTKLKSKSPSERFAEIGREAIQGMANGLSGSSQLVTNAASSIAESALAAMRSTMSRISEAFATEIDANPTITPVLDLTQMQKDAKKLSALTNVVPITAAASYGQAAAISETQMAQQAQTEPIDAEGVADAKVIKFEQNNYSPEALSEVEIYRLTSNQLSQAKAALKL